MVTNVVAAPGRVYASVSGGILCLEDAPAGPLGEEASRRTSPSP